MRIAIDARMIGAASTRGIGRYIEKLVHAMLEIAPEHEYVLIVRNSWSYEEKRGQHVEQLIADIPWYGLAEQLEMPRVLRSARADIVHIPHWNVPLAYRGPLIITIHDLLLRHEPLSAKASTRNFFSRMLKRFGYRLTLDHAISAAHKILVPTTFVANDVASFYPRAASKLVMSGEGMPEIVVQTTDDGSQATSDKRPAADYLLYVGSAYPHKGLADLLAAWKILSRTHPSLSLIIAGEMDIFMRRVQSLAAHQNLPRVVFLGHVMDEELHELYANATAFIYPTHFEGFGLPPLEAIAAGCPVIASDIDPLREVLTSEGARFFRAGDVDAILASVTDVIHHHAILRQRLPELAKRLAVRHDWKKVAMHTLAAYHAAHTNAISWQAHLKND